MGEVLGIVLHKQMTEPQRAFVEAMSLGDEPEVAAISAGYSEKSAGRISYELLRQPMILAAVQIAVARTMALDAAVSAKLLRRFVKEEKWDAKIRLAAANSILNRTGFIPPKAPERAGEGAKGLNEMTMDELRAERDKLEGEIAGRAKEVSSANAAPSATQAIDDII